MAADLKVDNKAIGAKIRRLREIKGWTKTRLAEAIEADLSTISKIESGDAGASLGILYRIAGALETTPDKLISKDKEEAV